MNQEEKEFYSDGIRVYKKVGKAIFGTLVVFISIFLGLNSILQAVFLNMTDLCMTISCFCGVIFTIFYCTFTILDELKKENK